MKITASRWLLGVMCVAASCVQPALAASAAATAHTSQIDIRNFAFAPKTLTVPVGTRVVWTNRDDEPHVIVSAGALFTSSHALDTSDSYAVTFSKPGTYAYFCSIHPMMVGSIIVQ
ncbi:cupredoxin domain-containing protein [Dyella subtropica]|uniref:cupredoxin domain-containing protein n=1 Tax=Dyella subtropica TaxID=2992127 RepID=UPI002254CDD9|nr:cupredoxin family copper-binding protein [Dyella subtropica]